MVFSFEEYDGDDHRSTINSGLIMGSEKELTLIDSILEYYRKNDCLLPNGRPNLTTVVIIVSNILKLNLLNRYRLGRCPLL